MMHELYIAECILRTARKALPPDTAGEDVETVHVRVGKLDAVMPESLVFLFDAIKSSHQMPNARLVVEAVEVHCRCHACEQDFDLLVPLFICPQCGSGNVRVLSGRGIVVQQLTVKEGASDEYSSRP